MWVFVRFCWQFFVLVVFRYCRIWDFGLLFWVDGIVIVVQDFGACLVEAVFGAFLAWQILSFCLKNSL